MKGLLLKDFYMTIKYGKTLFLVVLVFLAISCFDDGGSFFLVYPMILAGVLPMSLISLDEREKWVQYSGTLPYTRAQLVSSKYIIGLLLGIGAFILSMATTAGRMWMNGYFSLLEFGTIASLLLVLGLLPPTVLLPFVFKFGAEKGRIMFYVVIGLATAIGTLLAGFGFQMQMQTNEFAILFVMCTVAVLLYLGSWCFSVAFYKKREL